MNLDGLRVVLDGRWKLKKVCGRSREGKVVPSHLRGPACSPQRHLIHLRLNQFTYTHFVSQSTSFLYRCLYHDHPSRWMPFTATFSCLEDISAPDHNALARLRGASCAQSKHMFAIEMSLDLCGAVWVVEKGWTSPVGLLVFETGGIFDSSTRLWVVVRCLVLGDAPRMVGGPQKRWITVELPATNGWGPAKEVDYC